MTVLHFWIISVLAPVIGFHLTGEMVARVVFVPLLQVQTGSGISGWMILILVPVICALLVFLLGVVLLVIFLRRRARKGSLPKTQTSPVYSLRLASRHPENRVSIGGEIWVWARVITTNPRLQPRAEALTRQVIFQIEGPNSDWITSQPPVFKDGFQWLRLTAAAPDLGVVLKDGNPILAARCTDEKHDLEARLELGLNPELMLDARANGQKQAGVRYNRSNDAPGWVFPEMIVCFHNVGEGDKPAVPEFKVSFQNPPLKVEPPVLDVVSITEYQPCQYAIKVVAKGSEVLEQYLGKNLSAGDGVIKLTITASSDSGRIYQAAAAYQLLPQIEVFAYAWKDAQRWVNRDLGMSGLDILADGEDQLAVVFACCRTDKPGRREIGQVELIDPSWWGCKQDLQGEDGSNFSVLAPKEIPEGGRELFLLSRKPILFSQQSTEQKLTLNITAGLTEKAPANYQREKLACDLELKPHYPDLHLWLVPGKARGTTEAWMALFLDASQKKPLNNCTLQLEVSSPSSSSLSVDEAHRQGTCQTGKDGSAQLELHYHNLTWENLKEAHYMVSCTLPGKNGVTSSKVTKEIDVAENVRLLLADLFESGELLKLNNPYFSNQNLLKGIHLTTFRPVLRGPLWNMAGYITGRNPMSEENRLFRDFTSISYRNRLVEWLCERRNIQPGKVEDVEISAMMNGIEFDAFSFGTFHNWAAIFLAGMEPLDDPRGLDPWWKQHWQSRDYLEVDGLLNKAWERFFMVEVNNWITAVGVNPLLVLNLALFSSLGVNITLTSDTVAAIYRVNTVLSELQSDPDSCYDPASGYGVVVSARDTQEPLKKDAYLDREQFIKDWSGA